MYDLTCNMSPQMGADPSIHVWSAATLETLSVLSGHHQRAVVCLSLSQQGEVLASVGGDDHHTLVLWDWRSGRKLASARSASETEGSVISMDVFVLMGELFH